MAVIGKLLKKTNEISYKKIFKKGKDYNNQLRTLYKLLDKAKFTRFGNEYHFEGIVISENLVEDFQQTVPITYYEEFHDKWLATTIAGPVSGILSKSIFEIFIRNLSRFTQPSQKLFHRSGFS